MYFGGPPIFANIFQIKPIPLGLVRPKPKPKPNLIGMGLGICEIKVRIPLGLKNIAQKWVAPLKYIRSEIEQECQKIR
jgi:hypothetical protein